MEQVAGLRGGEPAGESFSVGVVIVTFNSKEHIASCLGSLPLAAADLRLSVVVVDNGSKDGTADIALESWPALRLMAEPINLGFSRAVNKAASALTACRYILLLNPDARMEAGSLKALVAALDASPRAAACGPHLRYPDGRHQISARPLPTLTSTVYDAFLLYHLRPRPDLVEQLPADLRPAKVDCLSGACMLIRRECFDALGGLDEMFFLYGEDVDFCARLRDIGRALLLVPEAVVLHVEGASAFTDRSQFFRELHLSRWQYARKHFGPIKAALAFGAQVAGLVARGILYSVGPSLGHPELRPYAVHQWTSIATLFVWDAQARRISRTDEVSAKDHPSA